MYLALDKQNVLKEGAQNEVWPFLAQKRGARDWLEVQVEPF